MEKIMKFLKQFRVNLAVIAVLAAVGFGSATAATLFLPVTTLPVARSNAFYTSNLAFDSTTIGQVGCETRFYLAGDSLRIGQVAYISAKNTVSHSATLVNYNSVAGVVLGGTRTSMGASYAKADTSTLAATSGQTVIICRQGRAYVLIDTTTGTGIAPGIQIIPGVSAVNGGGRVKARTTAIDSLNRIFGKMIDTGILGSAALAEIRVR